MFNFIFWGGGVTGSGTSGGGYAQDENGFVYRDENDNPSYLII